MSSSSSPSPGAAPSAPPQSEAKRRRLRKGTHSCWECKRRKIKCVFDHPTDVTTCNGCRRRGCPCISQEFPGDVSPDGVVGFDTLHNHSDGSIYNRRTPVMPSEDDPRPSPTIPTPLSTISEPSRYLAFHKSCEYHAVDNDFLKSAIHAPASQGKYERLSRFLHDSLPSRQDVAKICKASRHPAVLAHEIMTMPYNILEQNGLKTPDSLVKIIEPNLHPVMIARYMLLLATFIQHLHPDLHKEIKGLSDSPRAIMKRLADLAIDLVTTNDELLGSIEGLECIMLEAMYQANIGNLRRSWVAGRRAMSIAQLMGLNRSDGRPQYKVLDPNTTYHPRHMWFQIVFQDRYLCLMLGLSQGSLDRSMAFDAMLANDTPMGRLERIHCVIASRILERNESNSRSPDIDLTKTLDVELQKAARSLPSKWWLIPNLDLAASDPEGLFWSTRQLFGQVGHYNLLNQLHLPYMLRSFPAEHKYEYSRITCVNASREMLSRFITLRSFNEIAYSCRTIDFLALMAAITLLIAHLNSHLSEKENVLAHQYHSDRAMIERVQENMEKLNQVNSDRLSAQSADLLRRLLTIELETTDSYPRSARRVSVQEAGTETALPDQDDEAAVSVHIPYFGIIKIAREGMCKEVPESPATSATPARLTQSQVLDRSSTTSTEAPYAASQIRASGVTGPNAMPMIEPMINVDASHDHGEAPWMIPNNYAKTQAQLGTFPMPVTDVDNLATNFVPQVQNRSSDSFLQHEEYPELAAGVEDWVFQGVDMALFESLMRSTGSREDDSADWVRFVEASMSNRP